MLKQSFVLAFIGKSRVKTDVRGTCNIHLLELAARYLLKKQIPYVSCTNFHRMSDMCDERNGKSVVERLL